MPARRQFDGWLVEWLDGRYYAARWKWTNRLWGRIALWAVNRYWDRYGEGPVVTNG